VIRPTHVGRNTPSKIAFADGAVALAHVACVVVGLLLMLYWALP